MTNAFYNATGVPGPHAPLSSAGIRAEFAACAAGFDKLPASFNGNGGKVVRLNAGETALEFDPATYLTSESAASVYATSAMVAATYLPLAGGATTGALRIGGVATGGSRLTLNEPSGVGARAYSTQVQDFSVLHIEGNRAGSTNNAITFTSGGGGGAAVNFSRDDSFGTSISFWTNPTGGGSYHASNRGTIDPNGTFNWLGTITAANFNGPLAWTNVSGRPTALSQFTNDLTGVALSGGSNATGVWPISTIGYSGYVTSRAYGATAVLTGRTAVPGAYTYAAVADSNAPTTYMAGIGFGQGVSGAAEIGVQFTSAGSGMWYRQLRDVADPWGTWTRVVDSVSIVGYLGMPIASTPTNGAAIPISVDTTLGTQAAGFAGAYFNDTASPLSIFAGGGMTIRLAGTTATGTRTLAPYSFATVWYRSTSVIVIGGPGVS